MSWFSREARDTSQVDRVLAGIEGLGRRMGGLAMMGAEREGVIRTFKLDIIIDSVTGMKRTLVDARAQIEAGKVKPSKLAEEITTFEECVGEYDSYLDVLNQSASDGQEFFVIRPGVGSLF